MSDTEQLIKEVVQLAAKAYQAPAFKDRSVLKDPESPGLLLFLAARRLLGPEWVDWEPETLWLELPEVTANRDKLQVAQLLATYQAFYWDYRVFANVVAALNNQAVYPETIPELPAAFLSWAVFEAELIFALSEDKATIPEFNDEVEAFIGASLHHAGVVKAPENLEFCASHLKKLQVGNCPPVVAGSEEPTTNGVQVYMVKRLEDLRNRLCRFRNL